ncbi:hypothetical protein ACIO93_30490 [Streptomyces sp. NPDC087903]|uniref:hypothetical protein n=1 Tax=Streptomyces sp. NPDC087903 TaxID=3365819 RepID=UPI0037F44B8A
MLAVDRPETFQQHLRRSGERVLRRFPEALKAEMYLVSFRIWRVDQDSRHPYVAIGYNTESHFRQQMSRRPSPDPGETRWNYAYWLLEGFERLGNVPDDPVGSALYEQEVKRLGLWYEGPDEPDAESDLLHTHFADACIDLARSLHSGGHVEAALGRSVPVMIFDMDCPGWELDATQAANPSHLIADYVEHFAAD